MLFNDFNPGHDDMNRKVRNAVLSLYLLTFTVNVNVGAQALAVRAPELFGDGQAITLQTDTSLVGLIFAPGTVFAIVGSTSERDVSCRIVQLAGERVRGEVINGQPTVGSEVPVPCYLFRRGGQWIGWIDFRGHERAFCAAPSADDLPAVCRLRP